MAGQVDGYGPGEFDDIHWDLLVGAMVSVVAGVAFLYLSLDATGSAGTALLIAGAILVVAVLVGCFVSSFYRRYAFLVWWRRPLIIASALPFFLVKQTAVSILAFGQQSSRAAGVFGTRTATYRPNSAMLNTDSVFGSKAGETAVAVDEDGRVYEWKPWPGIWHYRADSLSGTPTGRLRVKQTIFGPVEPRPSEDESHSLVNF